MEALRKQVTGPTPRGYYRVRLGIKSWEAGRKVDFSLYHSVSKSLLNMLRFLFFVFFLNPEFCKNIV